MSEELKPVRCGCGCEARVCTHYDKSYYFVRCSGCFTRTDYKETEAEAIETWNTAMGTNARTLMKVFAYDATCGVCEKNKKSNRN